MRKDSVLVPMMDLHLGTWMKNGQEQKHYLDQTQCRHVLLNKCLHTEGLLRIPLLQWTLGVQHLVQCQAQPFLGLVCPRRAVLGTDQQRDTVKVTLFGSHCQRPSSGWRRIRQTTVFCFCCHCCDLLFQCPCHKGRVIRVAAFRLVHII